MTSSITEIPILDVVVERVRHRNVRLDDGVRVLARDIARVGLVHPITVRALGDGRWRLICGARRILAHQVLGRDMIEARVHPVDGGALVQLRDEMLEISENLQRLTLTPLQEAEHIARYDTLLDELGLRTRVGHARTETSQTTDQIASGLGISSRTYRSRVAVGRMSPAVRSLAAELPIAKKRGELIKLAYAGDENHQLAALALIEEGSANNVSAALEVLDVASPNQLPDTRVAALIADLMPTEESHIACPSGDGWSSTQAVRRVALVWADDRIKSRRVLLVLLGLALAFGEEDQVALTQERLGKLSRIGKTSLNAALTTAATLRYFERTPGLGRSPTIYRATGAWI